MSAIIRRLALCCLVALGLLAPACGAPSRTWHVDVLFIETSDSVFGRALKAFKQQVEARSHGRVTVDIHDRGQWKGHTLDEPQIVQAVVQGECQAALVTGAPLSNHASELELMNYPFLFKSYAHVDRVLDGRIGRHLLEALSAHGLHGLAFMDGGFRIFSTSRPITSLAEFNGLRVRAIPSRTYVNLVKAFRGVPVPSAVDKIYAMASRGYIDAADRSYPTWWSIRLYEVQKYITETNHAYSPKVLIVNDAFFKSLPPELQAAVSAAASTAAAGERKAFRAEVAEVKRQAAARGVRIITLGARERQAFEDASRPVQVQVTNVVGRALVDEARALAAP